MPHSSGGGSHGGGSHGGHGGGFGGHGGGGGSYKTSRTYFAGAHKYVYYHKKSPIVVYTNYDYKKANKAFPLFIFAFYFGFFGLSLLLAAAVMVFSPIKIRTNYDTSIVIEDNADLMSSSEEKELKKELNEFLDKTGIAPSVVTVNNEDWMGEYKNLEKYSYDLYLDMFEDEKHWLIVYSEPVTPDEEFNDWYWEGMQGDDTDSVLTRSKTSVFNSALQKKLTARTRYTVGESFTESFEEFNKVVMKKDSESLIAAVAVLFFALIMGTVTGLFIYFGVKITKQHRSSFECKEEVIRQNKCSYCGGVYIVGHHNNCPHCQAQIPFQDTPGYAGREFTLPDFNTPG